MAGKVQPEERQPSYTRPAEAGRDAITRHLAQWMGSSQAGYSIIPVSKPEQHLAQDVAAGLSQLGQKTLPCQYLYDAHGSRLYEDITALPEYYQARTEATLLQSIAPELRNLLEDLQLVELGSGSSVKTRFLLEAWQARQTWLSYVPIDVSESMLTESARQLVAQYRHLQVIGLCGEYADALAALPPASKRLVLFLGGTLGNFNPAEQTQFFQQLSRAMQPGHMLLLGFDLQPHARKPVAVIEQAYNDAAGVTAAFNQNMLTHINRELGADFNLAQWQHRADYNRTLHQIEMRLQSTCSQVVQIRAINQTVRFSTGDTILTEISRRFDPHQLIAALQSFGLRFVTLWTDPNRYFGLMLLQAESIL